MSIATQTGDDGTTALLFNKRVSKTHPRVMTYGRIDELGSALGLCRAHSDDESTKRLILTIQKELISLMGELSTDDADQERYHKHYGRDAINQEKVDRFTELVRMKEETVKFRGWTFAGDTIAEAFFDNARTCCRRSERGVVALKETGAIVRPEIIQYLNRLGDLLWLWGREHA
ncbi:cob(I)yrinic acid a,c-diamide adenosyltransferase [Coraliomargarita parva]|uniref:cob(I)yrinic acid a,c-diamide adenosyltransferase n=1 Tax=Coraliomargarita parva TaxID=3014050 RepID=UPI0022B596AB|nr:cob(I)yrinic acid a,c-diamide adenosyltransferase [Coraliomargarita parva]